MQRKSLFGRALLVSGISVVSAVLAGGTAQAELLYGITDQSTSRLFSLDTATPGSATVVGSVSGLVSGHSLRGIDFRPSTGQLYAVSTNNPASAPTTPPANSSYQIYTVNLTTAALTPVGPGFTLPFFATRSISIDFNPRVDLIRFVNGGNHNVRVSPVTGQVVGIDTNLAFDASDVNADNTLLVADIAYSNNVPGAQTTTLYGYDYESDSLVTVGSVNGSPDSPNTGKVFTVGASGLLSGFTQIGLDISSTTGNAYLSTVSPGSSGTDQIYSVNLNTGAVSSLGNVASPAGALFVRDISVAIPEPSALSLLGLPAIALVRRRR